MQSWWNAGRMLAVVVLAKVVLATVTTQAAGPNGCSIERATTVCHAAGQALRVVHDSHSPSGRYAVAWIVSAPGVTVETDPADGTVSATGGEVRNSLIRLQDIAVLAPDAGTHPGDLAAYNHRRSEVRWSADSSLVGILNHDKWETLTGKIFTIGRDGHAIGPFDLLAFGHEAGRRKLAGLRPGTDTDDYTARVTIDSIGHDGLIRTRVTMEQPGGGGPAYAFSISLRVGEVSAGLQAREIRLGRLRRIE